MNIYGVHYIHNNAFKMQRAHLRVHLYSAFTPEDPGCPRSSPRSTASSLASAASSAASEVERAASALVRAETASIYVLGRGALELGQGRVLRRRLRTCLGLSPVKLCSINPVSHVLVEGRQRQLPRALGDRRGPRAKYALRQGTRRRIAAHLHRLRVNLRGHLCTRHASVRERPKRGHVRTHCCGRGAAPPLGEILAALGQPLEIFFLLNPEILCRQLPKSGAPTQCSVVVAPP